MPRPKEGITIDEAIQDLKGVMDTKKPLEDKDYFPALKLGTEALNAWKNGRQKHGWFYYPLLPGETKERG